MKLTTQIWKNRFRIEEPESKLMALQEKYIQICFGASRQCPITPVSHNVEVTGRLWSVSGKAGPS